MSQASEPRFVLDTISVIIGLGNPGPKFHLNRHNIGFLFVDAIAQRHGVTWRMVQNALMATITVNGKDILLIKPQTFMNSSGDVWRALAKKGIKPEAALVVHDELEKGFGATQIRLGGSARGHNGLRSLISRCGEGFWRLRLGIGRPAERNEVPDYVLTNFTVAQQQGLESFLEKAADVAGLR